MRAGELDHWPLRFAPWCCSASFPRAGKSSICAPSITVLPFNTTVTDFPRTVISNWFHSPTGLSACVRGVTAARTAGVRFASIRTPYISPEPMGQHQMLS